MENNKTFETLVKLEDVGMRLDRFLGLTPEIGSRSRAAQLIEKQLVQIESGAKIIKNPKPSYEIQNNDIIKVTLPTQSLTSEILPLNLDLDIVFEDDDLIVINKPAGLVVHPAAGHAADTLVNALIHHTKNLSMKFGENRPGIVHRIDRDTSGLLVIAKNDFAHEKLSQQFKNKTTHRIYWAICHGHFKNLNGTFISFLARHPVDRKRMASLRDQNKKIIRDLKSQPENGKLAITHYQVIKSYNNELSLLHLKLETGRTHQIRVHLSEDQHPILNDLTYGSDLKKLKSTHLRSVVKNLNRFVLHAAELGFTHPRDNRKMSFSAHWPEELKMLISSLEKVIND